VWSTDLLSFYNAKQSDRPQNKWWNKHISDLFICFVSTVIDLRLTTSTSPILTPSHLLSLDLGFSVVIKNKEVKKRILRYDWNKKIWKIYHPTFERSWEVNFWIFVPTASRNIETTQQWRRRQGRMVVRNYRRQSKQPSPWRSNEPEKSETYSHKILDNNLVMTNPIHVSVCRMDTSKY
jgi:hypothetical protein